MGVVALLFAILPALVLPMIYPAPPIEERAAEAVVNIKDRVVAKLKKQEYQSPVKPQNEKDRWYEVFRWAAAVFGSLAILLGTVGIVRKEPVRICISAIGLGTAAIVMEYVLGVAALIFAIALFAGFIT